MKISNETKVGALTAVAITLLILGFNFLKGKSLFRTGTYIYAKYKDTKGLMASNPVYINGLQVGNVDELEEGNKNLDHIIVAIKLSKEINIPSNSVANISSVPLSGSTLEITMGDAKTYLKSGDTIKTSDNAGMLGDIQERVGPVVDQVKVTLETMDSVLRNMNSIFDPYTKNNMQSTVANINRATASLVVSSAELQMLLNNQTGSLARSLDNVNAFTRNLAGNNEKVTSVLSNMQTTTANLSKADIEGTVSQLQTTIARLNSTVEKIDSKQGSIGLLLNDNQLYTNLANTSRSLNILMDDLRVNPKRYLTIGVSLFGSKSKAQPLMAPLPVPDTVNTAITTGTQ